MSDLLTWTALGTVVLGFGSGVLAGMFGIGGAVLTTPAIRVLGATPIEGVGSTVPSILPGSVSGAYRYARAGLVDWRVGLICGCVGGLFAAFGAWLAGQVNAHYLMLLTAALMAFSGISLIRSSRTLGPEVAEDALLAGAGAAEVDGAEAVSPAAGVISSFRPTTGAGTAPGAVADGDIAGSPGSTSPVVASTGDRPPSARLLALVGAGAGFMAGLLGVGGGVVMIPAFTGLLKLPMKVAVGSSLVAVAIFSLPALITHTLLHHIAWRFAIPLVIGVVPGAQVGAKLSFASSEVLVRRLFGVSVLAMSVVYGISEVLGLR